MDTFSIVVKRLSKIYNRRSIRYGLPFLLLVLGGSFGLKEFAQLRYQFSKTRLIKPEDVEKLGIKMKPQSEVTLESEYEKVQKLDLENWSQKRGPRPWESEN